MTTEKLLTVLCVDVLSEELEPLGLMLDRLETPGLKTPAAERAKTFQAIALRARKLITSGIDVPSVRRECLKSPSLMALLEAVLFDRAAARGALAVSVDWSRYGR